MNARQRYISSVLVILLATAAMLASGVATANPVARADADFDFTEPSELAGDFEILVQERKKRFTPGVIKSPPGTVQFTVKVPRSAQGMHGVGIDGGTYKDVKGAAVKPGRTTSLTIDVTPGRYVIFDSYKKNRRKGFRTKLIVEKPAQ